MVGVEGDSYLKRSVTGERRMKSVRQGLEARARIDTGKALPCFTVPEDAEAMPLERTTGGGG